HPGTHERGVHACRRRQYHHRSFRPTAESLGLTVEQMPHYGYAHTKLPSAVAQLYEPGLVVLREVLISRSRPVDVRLGVDTPDEDHEGGEEVPRSRHLKATCACGLIIRPTKKTLMETVIRCDTFGQ